MFWRVWVIVLCVQRTPAGGKKDRSSTRDERRSCAREWSGIDEEKPGGKGRRWRKKRRRRRWYHQVARIEAGQGQNVVEPSRIIFSASYYCAKLKSVKCLGGRLDETVPRYTLLPRVSLLSASNANFYYFIPAAIRRACTRLGPFLIARKQRSRGVTRLHDRVRFWIGTAETVFFFLEILIARFGTLRIGHCVENPIERFKHALENLKRSERIGEAVGTRFLRTRTPMSIEFVCNASHSPAVWAIRMQCFSNGILIAVSCAIY